MHEVVPNPGEKDPAKQFLQAVEPSTGALCPMAHKSQVLRPVTLVNEPKPHDWHESCPSTALAVPMGQGRQADAPAAEYVPIGQAAQLDIFRPEAKKPATHGAHAAWAATPLNVPA